MQKKSSRAAFTLVELLVVIGIISVLVSMLLPALNKARAAALEVVCRSNLRQFGIGLQMYADANKGALPEEGPDGSDKGANFFGPSGGVIGYNDPGIWFNALPPYVSKKSYYQQLVDAQNGLAHPPHAGDDNMFICPTSSDPLIYPGTSGSLDVVVGGYYWLNGIDSTGYVKNPTGLLVNKQFPFDMSYVWNSKLTADKDGTAPPDLRMCQCRPSSEVVVMVEKMANYAEYNVQTVQNNRTAYNTAALYDGKLTALGLYNNVGQSKSCWSRFTTRHRSGGHLLFADGHVAWFSWLDAQIPLNIPTINANQPGKMIWCPLGITY